MDYTTLGRTGLQVSIMGFGCGGPSRVGLRTGNTEAESVAVIRQAIEAGVNFIDTAEAYETEEFVGNAIKGLDRESLVISTKKSTWEGITPQEVRQGLENSLTRLGTEYVDIYHLHGVELSEYDYLLVEIVPTLHALRDEGKIRFLGISEKFIPDPGHEMLQRALQDDVWDVMMVGFNILNQSARTLVFPKTIEKNIGVLVMFAVRLALSRPERLREVLHELIETHQIDPAEVDLEAPLDFLIHDDGATSLTDAAYRFCRDEPGTHVILSGTGNPEHLRANIASLSRPPLPPDAVNKLKRIFHQVDSVSGQ
ncbi:aldo/keto reductase [candidate division KSB3 bacterium]|uniref:Aldo/keto reductase n=1 Tax=candidate division KSB3 bacterium TaxID=2044937 RepID=A0A9D5Q508_9BACT|nr:aldo/keto reductase [candidate division KSB3 bacterium]MBD3323446.1 aldo/keto reductase [candidate division KSB3 bacterium]